MKKLIGFFIVFPVVLLFGLPSSAQEQKKKNIAVLTFVNSGGVDKNEISILTNRFSNYLVSADVYEVLEREKMEMLLKEQDFSMSDNCNSSECAVQIGKLLSVDLMAAGQVGKFGDVYTLDIRIIDISTGKILKTKSENYEGKKEGLLDMIEELAYTLSGQTAPLKRTTKTTTDKSSTVTGKTTTDDTGDEITIGKVEKKYGSLEINNEIDGTLYIDEKKIGEVSRGSVIPIEKLKTGEHTIKITYSDGEFTEKVTIEYNRKTKLTSDKKSSSSFIDPRDGKTYKTVKIGNQVWMAENLNYATSSGSWCYDGNSSNCKKYGRLYDWETAKKVAPPGWHLPSKEEWETLLSNLGSSESAAYKKMITGGSSGFTALFVGVRMRGDDYDGIGTSAHFWLSSGYSASYAWSCYMSSNDQKAYVVNGNHKEIGLSVRCLKD